MKAICLILLLNPGLMAQPTPRKYPLVSIDHLAAAKSDTVRIVGYAADIYVCPSCPPGAQCKPCIENHFFMTDRKPRDPQNPGLKVRVFTDNPNGISAGRKYEAVVYFRGSKRTPENLGLISMRQK
jgi:hypothetical protein